MSISDNLDMEERAGQKTAIVVGKLIQRGRSQSLPLADQVLYQALVLAALQQQHASQRLDLRSQSSRRTTSRAVGAP